jgi:hypothetical protein
MAGRLARSAAGAEAVVLSKEVVEQRNWRIAGLLVVALSLTATVYAQARTDVVTLANGDVITGELSKVERGQLRDIRPTMWGRSTSNGTRSFRS